jgi:hypothetical protein
MGIDPSSCDDGDDDDDDGDEMDKNVSSGVTNFENLMTMKMKKRRIVPLRD